MKRIIFTVLVLALVLGCTPTEEDPKEKIDDNVQINTVTLGMKADMVGFHPNMQAYETATLNVNKNIFDSLVQFDHKFKIKPSLAEYWSNPDKLTWRFNLRKGVRFHNGEKMTAEDVKYTFDFIMEDKDNALKNLVSPIKKVEIVDNYTIDIKTKDPTPVLLHKLADVFIVPKDHERLDRWPVGTGPYKLKKYEEEKNVILERFEDYWGKNADIETAIMRIIPEAKDRINAFRAGKIDLAEFIPPDQYEELKEEINMVSKPTSRVIFLGTNFREGPTAELKVRKAMYHAIDEQEIIEEVMKGLAEPATQFVSPEILGYNPEIERLEHDKEKARELLKEAGYEDGFNITLDCPDNRYVKDEEICKRVSEQLGEIGIDVKANAKPKSEFFEKILARESDFYLLGWVPTTGDGGEVFDYLLTTVNKTEGEGNYNLGYYSNERVDEITGESSRILDTSERKDLLQEGFRIAMDDVAWIPLHRQSLTYAVSEDLTWRPRADTKLDLETISYDKP
ncbi:MAG: ABC transporter substrate-binding protein [Nanobdellota archaeon]